MKKILIFFAALVFGLVAFLYAKSDQGSNVVENKEDGPVTEISIEGKPFKAILRDDPASRALGLSGRGSLEEDEAMLFAFPNEGLWGIWMRDMNFSSTSSGSTRTARSFISKKTSRPRHIRISSFRKRRLSM